MTHRLRNRLALLLVLLAGAGTAVAPALGQGSGGDTSAVAINTKDGSSLFKLTFQIRKVTGEVVDNQNAAVAYASCNQCQTVAISIQVLLVTGSPTVFTPTNVALAINEACTLCNTMALAYQFAVGMDTKLKFTPEGRQQLADLRRQLEELRKSGLSIEEIQSKAAGIIDQLSTVLSSQLEGVQPEEEPEPQDGQADDGEEAAPSTETTPDPAETAPAEQPAAEPDPSTEATPADDAETPADAAPSSDTTQDAPPAVETTPAP